MSRVDAELQMVDTLPFLFLKMCRIAWVRLVTSTKGCFSYDILTRTSRMCYTVCALIMAVCVWGGKCMIQVMRCMWWVNLSGVCYSTLLCPSPHICNYSYELQLGIFPSGSTFNGTQVRFKAKPYPTFECWWLSQGWWWWRRRWRSNKERKVGNREEKQASVASMTYVGGGATLSILISTAFDTMFLLKLLSSSGGGGGDTHSNT